MVGTAILEEGYFVVRMALLFAVAGGFHHAGIKIPFFAQDSKHVKTAHENPVNVLDAMAISAVLWVVMLLVTSLVLYYL